MMYLGNRHPYAQQWLRVKFIQIMGLTHLYNLGVFKISSCVVCTLPIDKATYIADFGVHYLQCLEIPANLHGEELSVEKLGG